MKKDLDLKLYNEYLNGDKIAFELLYNKYKDKYNTFQETAEILGERVQNVKNLIHI